MADSPAKEFDLASKDYTEIRIVAGGAVVAGVFVPDATYATPHYFAIGPAEAAGDEIAACIQAKRVKVAVTVGITATAGQKAYFDASENEVTDVLADGDYFIGYFAEAVGSSDTHGYITYDGTIESNAAGIAIGTLKDVDLSTPATDGQQLTFEDTGDTWQAGAAS